ncbi:unnamed protein product [Mytilus coruscus]|uniref:COR domain-containing protein n=1 Tax=Mytilus coruscus TaxID=42192 RepID=A0A6J8DSS9_MYTCO|nr:unnamed protein product [Mytilus coruscus]
MFFIVGDVEIIETAITYEFKCPAHAEWRLRAKISCLAEDKYVCLFHLPKQKYQDNCLGSKRSSIGSNLVFQPLFNIAECKAGRYQPIVFNTHGNSECILLNSKCDEEGQVVYRNGTSDHDITCRCDYTKGYAFVSKTENNCFCKPAEEDCSCFRVKCTELSPDYECILNGETLENTECQEMHPQLSYSTQSNIVQFSESFIENQLTLYADSSEISEHMIGNETEDTEKQKFIHELLLKGECGKFYFTRVVFIGKNGVGKSSLMRRLLWQNKEDVISSKSTDGIEVEKCNINIANGKWSPCDKIDDEISRLIHQEYTEKNLNVEKATAENGVGLNTGKSRGVSDHESLTSSDESIDKKTDSENSENDDVLVEIYNRRENVNSFISENKENPETVEIDSNQIQPEEVIIQNVLDEKTNQEENKSDTSNDENINQLTSKIIKSYIERRQRTHDDMSAFCLLWDFAGQKDFYATHQVFLSNSAVYLLVTDGLDFTTTEEQGMEFDESAQHVSFWFDAIHCYWSSTEKSRLDPPIIVVCTNEDKIKEPLERKERQEKFTANLGKILKNQKKKKHLRYVYFVSNTEDEDNVFEEIRNKISQQAMDMKDWGRVCPLKWLLFQQVLLKLKENGVPISTTTKLFKIAKHDDIAITTEKEFKLCLQYCHDKGTVIYFEEENLRDHVILDPKWLVDAFRCLVSDKIENNITLSDDWQNLTETGELTDKLISRLFKKEPQLKFSENKTHLLEVMKRFDIIVNLRNSDTLYMPCMIKSCTIEELAEQFFDGSQSCNRTSWLCLKFKFLPPAFYNHILAWYIKMYSVSVILERGTRTSRKAIYRHIGVFNLDESGCEQLVVCEGPNIIALQVWNSQNSKKTYEYVRKDLYQLVGTLQSRYRLKLSFTRMFKCKDGDFTIHQNNMNELLKVKYRCLEHKTDHLSDDLVKPWALSKLLQKQRVNT